MEKQAVKREDQFLEYAHGHEGFADWLRAVDRRVMGRYLMSIWDLPDMCFRDAFEDGESAEDFFLSNVMDVMAEEFGADE